jgi:hypothetical protein
MICDFFFLSFDFCSKSPLLLPVNNFFLQFCFAIQKSLSLKIFVFPPPSLIISLPNFSLFFPLSLASCCRLVSSHLPCLSDPWNKTIQHWAGYQEPAKDQDGYQDCP